MVRRKRNNYSQADRDLHMENWEAAGRPAKGSFAKEHNLTASMFSRWLQLAGKIPIPRGGMTGGTPPHLQTVAQQKHGARGTKRPRRTDTFIRKVLADCYHMFLEKESYDIIHKAKEQLAHVHIADGDRYFPGHSPSGGMDFIVFFDALKKSGYDGLISTEAKFDDFESEAAVSNAFTRKLWE